MHDLAVHIRQPHVAAAEPVRQPFMVKAEQVKNGRVQIVLVPWHLRALQ